MEHIAIKTLNLTKKFGENTAIDKISLEVKRGELFGLVGPDGAGKTTTMRLLTSIMEPTEGEAWISGFSILKDPEKVKEKIGYMSQRFGLYEDLTVMENMDFYADLYTVPPSERPSRIKKLLEFSNLFPFKSRLAGDLSGGMKQKLGLACTLIHTPEVLFLDEPTNGVDPVSRRDFWRILYGLLKEGISVFVSTSYLDEAERCSRVALINKGRILVVDEPSRIRQSLKKPMMEVWVDSPLSAAEIIKKTQGIIRISAYGDRLHIIAEKKEVFEKVISDLKSKNINIEGQREIIPSLEDVFISMVDGK
ncbi:MAG: ABC transporter ATP-binding protein [bacterium]